MTTCTDKVLTHAISLHQISWNFNKWNHRAVWTRPWPAQHQIASRWRCHGQACQKCPWAVARRSEPSVKPTTLFKKQLINVMPSQNKMLQGHFTVSTIMQQMCWIQCQWRSGSDWGRQAVPRSWCRHWKSMVAEFWTVRQCHDQRVRDK